MRVAVPLAVLGLSFQVLMSNACAPRHYTMTVKEVVPRPAPRRTQTFRGPADLRNSEQRAQASNASGQPGSAQSSDPLVATTGDEQQSLQSTRGSSETNAKPSESIGGIQDSHVGAEAESQPPMDGFSMDGRLLLLGAVIVVVVLCAVLARRRVPS